MCARRRSAAASNVRSSSASRLRSSPTTGTLAVAALAVHTGGRLGANLNFVLLTLFLGVAAAGAAAGGIVALEHRLGARGAQLRRAWQWTHLLLFWPIPVLLALHVLKSYYF